MSKGIYYLARTFLRILFSTTGGLEVTGLENVPLTGGLIVASNHTSYLDPMVLGAAFNRPLHFMARKSLFNNFFFGWLIRQTLAFPLNREGDIREAVKEFTKILQQDEAVVLFPEGTRSSDGYLQPLKFGLGMIALRLQAPILPVYIWGSYQSWSRGTKYPRRHKLHVFIGEAIPPLSSTLPDKAKQRELVSLTENSLKNLESLAYSNSEKLLSTDK